MCEQQSVHETQEGFNVASTPAILTCELLVHAFSGLCLIARPHLAEVCFLVVGLCRLAVGLCFGSEVMPMTSALQWWMDNHMEKLFEVFFSGQMRLSMQIPLRVCLVFNYASTYTRLQKPYPWITAILMQLAAAAFQLVMSTTNPWQLLGLSKSRQAPAAAAAMVTAAAAAATTTPNTMKKLLGSAGPGVNGGLNGSCPGDAEDSSPGNLLPTRCTSTHLFASKSEEEPGGSRKLLPEQEVPEPCNVCGPEGRSLDDYKERGPKGQSSTADFLHEISGGAASPQQAPNIAPPGSTQPSHWDLGSRKALPLSLAPAWHVTAAADSAASRQKHAAAGKARAAAANTVTATPAADAAAANTVRATPAAAANTVTATSASNAAATRKTAAATRMACCQQQARSKVDPQTLQQLKLIRSTLQSRQKYVTHFIHHMVSFKVPCQSEPSSLKPDALSNFGCSVRASMSDVEVLNAAMRAGCIILCADIMVRGSLRPRHQYRASASGAAGAAAGAGAIGPGDSERQGSAPDEAELGRAMAAAAQQWLVSTRLAEELPPSATVLLQVDGSYFLCRHLLAATQDDNNRATAASEHDANSATAAAERDTNGTAAASEHQEQQSVWDVQGPQPLSLLLHTQPLLSSCTICTTSPTVLLPCSSAATASSSSHLTAAEPSLPAYTSNTAASGAVFYGVGALQSSTLQHPSHSEGSAHAGTEDCQCVAIPAAVVVQIRVQVPRGAEILGWQESNGRGAVDADAADACTGAVGTGTGSLSSAVDVGAADADTDAIDVSHALQLKVLACLGSHYLQTSVTRCPVMPAAAAEGPAAAVAAAVPGPGTQMGHLGATDAGMETQEFDVAIPVNEVCTALGTDNAHALPAGVRLELWHQELLLDSSLVLLLPGSVANVHEELQRLPWGRPDANSDVYDFVVDVGAWMQQASTLLTAAASTLLTPPVCVAGGESRPPLQRMDIGADEQVLAPAPASPAQPAERGAVTSGLEPATASVLAPSAAAAASAAERGAVAQDIETASERPNGPNVNMPCAPASLPAPALAPRDATALCTWGVQLLRQAVLWGLPSLSTLLVEQLLSKRMTPSWAHLMLAASAAPGTQASAPAPPALEFSAARMDQRNQGGLRQEVQGEEQQEQGQQQQQQPQQQEEEEMEELDVDDLGGLLHLSLLCPCPQQMLRAVIGWGQRWGQQISSTSTTASASKDSGGGGWGDDAGCGFGWKWDEPNPLGLTPCELLDGDRDALLRVLLEVDPAAWLSAQQALDRQQLRNSAEVTDTRHGFEQGAHGLGVTRNGVEAALGEANRRNLRQLESFVSYAMGMLRQRHNGEGELLRQQQQQQQGHTEDGACAMMVPCKCALWKAALRSTLFGLGNGTPWEGGLVGPSEQSYMEWVEGYTRNMLAVRFNFLLLGCVVGVVRSLANGLLCQSEVLLQYSITSAYFWGILKRRQKDGMRYARYGHIAMWAFLGLGILPMENNTISMVATYSESLVLFALFSPVLEQSSLRALLLERLSTTCVFCLLFNTLGVRAPLLRAVVQNALSAAAELVFIGVHLRYTFLKSWADSQHQKALQARKGM